MSNGIVNIVPGQVAQSVQPNPKCDGCMHYNSQGGQTGVCVIGTRPWLCGDGDAPSMGYAPVSATGPSMPGSFSFPAQVGNPGQSHTEPSLNYAEAGHGSPGSVGEEQVPITVCILGDHHIGMVKAITEEFESFMRSTCRMHSQAVKSNGQFSLSYEEQSCICNPVRDIEVAKALVAKLSNADRQHLTGDEVLAFVGAVRNNRPFGKSHAPDSAAWRGKNEVSTLPQKRPDSATLTVPRASDTLQTRYTGGDSLSKSEKKGEGSRGGHITGHTKSGHPIYGHADTTRISPHHAKKWTSGVKAYQKHLAALSGGDKDAWSHAVKARDKLSNLAGSGEVHDTETANLLHEHIKALGNVGEAQEQGAAVRQSARTSELAQLKQQHREAAPRPGSYEHELATMRNKSLSKAEGAHGGHVIGHTKSGKPIYGTHAGSETHAAWNDPKFSQAISKQNDRHPNKAVRDSYRAMSKRLDNGGKAHVKEHGAGFSKQDHVDAASAHYDKARALREGHEDKENLAHPHHVIGDSHMAVARKMHAQEMKAAPAAPVEKAISEIEDLVKHWGTDSPFHPASAAQQSLRAAKKPKVSGWGSIKVHPDVKAAFAGKTK